MRLSIDHQTGFRYASPVKSSYNEARMTPAATEQQTVWSSRVSIEPAAWSFTYTDYWGTTVTTFELHEPHERLTVHAQGVVETHGDELAWDIDRRVAPNDLGWPALRDRGVIDTMTEFLTVNDRTQPPDELLALAAEVADQPPRLAGLDVCGLVHDRLTYQRGSTAVTSTAREVWELGRGVCQDYSHVALGRPALDRAAGPLRLGLPAPGRRRANTRSPGRATPGSSGGAAAGCPTTRRCGAGSPTATSGSGTAATTATWPRCAAPTPAGPRRCSSPWR